MSLPHQPGCGSNRTLRIGDGKYHCVPCDKGFTFKEWFMQVTTPLALELRPAIERAMRMQEMD